MMETTSRPPVPLSQRVFGDVVYWITIIACILCIVGPLVAVISPGENVINPHFLMKDIFDGKPPESGVGLESSVAAGDTVVPVSDVGEFEAGQTIVIKDEEKTETAVIEAVNEENKALVLASPLANSYSPDSGAEVAEETIWDGARDGVRGGHFWKDFFTSGDGLTQFGLALGCGVGFFATMIAGFIFLMKERSPGWALASLWIASMIAISAVGLVSLH